MNIDQPLIDEIVRRILTVAKASRIILFGAAATGKMNRDSDIDLLLIEDEVSNRREEVNRIRGALTGIGCPCDVIVMPTVRFEESKDVIGGIAFPANQYGKVVHSAA